MTDTGEKLTHGMLDGMVNNKDMITIMSKALPAATSMQLAKIIRKCSNELKEYIEKKQEIIQEYSQKDDNGAPITQPGDMVLLDNKRTDEARDKLREIADIPVGNGFELPTFKFNSDAFPNITPQEALAILPFLNEE